MNLRQTFARLFRRTKSPMPDMRSAASVAVVWDKDITGAHHLPFPRFQANANDHLATHASGRFARQRLALLEVFSPSRPVGDRKRFAGRSDVLTSLIRAIEEQRLHIVMYGPRGVGKTSLLHVLTQAARDVRYLVVYVSCGTDSSFDEIFRTIAAAIPMLYHGGVGPTSSDVETGKTLADTLAITPISARAASDLLANIVGTRVMVVLDEFDRSQSKVFRRDVAELIKNLSDRLVRVELVIAGVASDLKELVEHTPSIQRNIFAMRVPWMSADEVRELVSKGAEACGLTFAEESIELIGFAATGSPFLASLLAHRAGLRALDNGRSEVLVSDTGDAVKAAITDFRTRLSVAVQMKLQKFAHDGHTRALGMLGGVALRCGGDFRLEDIRNSQAGLDVNVRGEQLLAQLRHDGILVQSSNNISDVYHFSEDGIAAYLWLSLAMMPHLSGKPEVIAVAHALQRD